MHATSRRHVRQRRPFTWHLAFRATLDKSRRSIDFQGRSQSLVSNDTIIATLLAQPYTIESNGLQYCNN